MRMTIASVGLALALFAGAAQAQNIVGFRGDGSGRFPKADPPTQWGKVSTVLAGLRSLAEQPKDLQAAGTPACTGAVLEWQVVGPFPAETAAKALDEAVVADEAALQPDSSGKVNGLAWRKVTVPGTTLDFSPLFEKDNPSFERFPAHELNIIKAPFVAYAHTWLYAAEEGKAIVRVRARNAAKLWLNGELIYPSKAAAAVTLRKGWNRLLAKTANHVIGKRPASVWSDADYPSWWFLDLSLSAPPPFEAQTKNIRWQAALPSFGVACPVIVGDRVFVLAEPGRVICVDKRDGAVLWDREPTFFDALSAAERTSPAFKAAAAEAAKLDAFRGLKGLLPADAAKQRDAAVAQVNKLMAEADAARFTVKASGHGNCLGTPVSDGKALYVALGNGLVASYTLDGTLRWASAVSPERNQEHGTTSSAALTADTLLVFRMDLAGLDLATGRIRWKTDIWRKEPPYGDITHQTPVTFRVGASDYAFIHGIVIRVSDGELIQENRDWTERQIIPTPVIDGGTLYVLSSSGHLLWGPLPTSADKIALGKPAEVPTFSRIIGAATRGFACSSPLIHDGLAYVVDAMGNLFVIDLKEKAVVYRRDLGTGLETRSVVHMMGTAYASPVLAGKHIYVFGMDGTTVVLKPGRTYEEVARNKIEDTVARNYGVWPEGFASTPVAEGKFLYVRGDKYLYCIGEK